MERHSFNLSFRNFLDGRVLGSQKRSHFLPLTIPARDGCPVSLVEERRQDSDSSATLDEKAERDSGREEEGEVRFQNYGLRDNPEKNIIRVANPEIPVEEHEEGSVSSLLLDGKSETESSKNLTRRLPKRARKRFPLYQEKLGSRWEEISEVKVGDSSELVCSIWEETRDEDVAFCLMLLSRDRAEMVKNHRDETEVRSTNGKKVESSRGKHRCETCNKHFGSYRALGGHRASHVKARAGVLKAREDRQHNNLGSCNNKVHECPFCYRVFASGQALGGHKRSHTGNSNYFAVTTTTRTVPEIDLNMPELADDERVEFGGSVRDRAESSGKLGQSLPVF